MYMPNSTSSNTLRVISHMHTFDESVDPHVFFFFFFFFFEIAIYSLGSTHPSHPFLGSANLFLSLSFSLSRALDFLSFIILCFYKPNGISFGGRLQFQVLRLIRTSAAGQFLSTSTLAPFSSFLSLDFLFLSLRST